VRNLLPDIRHRMGIDFVIANAENAAGGLGMTEATVEELLEAGVDAVTGGDHSWDRRDAHSFLDECDRVVRPANYPEGVPGRGYAIIEASPGLKVGVLNLLGRTFMPFSDCPFRASSGIVPDLLARTPIVVVDFHAEATSEKVALGLHLAGRVSAVLGTHTHVPTADARILNGHTAYVTDVGMTGPIDSIIGMRTDVAFARLTLGIPRRYEAARGRAVLNAALVEVDEETGAARSIGRYEAMEDPQDVEQERADGDGQSGHGDS